MYDIIALFGSKIKLESTQVIDKVAQAVFDGEFWQVLWKVRMIVPNYLRISVDYFGPYPCNPWFPGHGSIHCDKMVSLSKTMLTNFIDSVPPVK